MQKVVLTIFCTNNRTEIIIVSVTREIKLFIRYLKGKVCIAYRTKWRIETSFSIVLCTITKNRFCHLFYSKALYEQHAFPT